MKSNLTINDVNLTKEESRQLLFRLINERIEFLNLIATSRWEQNHNDSIQGIESKIEELKKKRAELANSIDNLTGDDELFDVCHSIEISCSEKKQKQHAELVM